MTVRGSDALCRDCLQGFASDQGKESKAALRCPACQSPRVVRHDELHRLQIAHIDCDAFYANVEKRDRPELQSKPVIVGGGQRGVVSTCCYIARLYGVHSAMPMFKALKACPDAIVLRPDMAKYGRIGRQIREMMREVTPLVEPLSIDEAFLDLTGTEALHGQTPATTLAAFANCVSQELDLTLSIGLSYNKFLAKIASDLDKPSGFAVIGETEAVAFLKPKPVGIIWGVGKALRRTLARDGIVKVEDLHAYDEATLTARYGAMGRRLYSFSRAQDSRTVEPNAPTKSISAETTFSEDLTALPALLAELWPLCETVAGRLKRANLAGHTATLKLKTSDFRTLTRNRRLSCPSQFAEVLYQAVLPALKQETGQGAFRLIGVGAADLVSGDEADLPDLLDPVTQRTADIERAMDDVREKLGPGAIRKGRGLLDED